jgi:hypothetical protein
MSSFSSSTNVLIPTTQIQPTTTVLVPSTVSITPTPIASLSLPTEAAAPKDTVVMSSKEDIDLLDDPVMMELPPSITSLVLPLNLLLGNYYLPLKGRKKKHKRKAKIKP